VGLRKLMLIRSSTLKKLTPRKAGFMIVDEKGKDTENTSSMFK
jgi:hypothetical protein